jgi:hypothetical protein
MPVSATKEELDKSEAVFCGHEVLASVSLSLWILSKLRPNIGPPTEQLTYFNGYLLLPQIF